MSAKSECVFCFCGSVHSYSTYVHTTGCSGSRHRIRQLWWVCFMDYFIYIHTFIDYLLARIGSHMNKTKLLSFNPQTDLIFLRWKFMLMSWDNNAFVLFQVRREFLLDKGDKNNLLYPCFIQCKTITKPTIISKVFNEPWSHQAQNLKQDQVVMVILRYVVNYVLMYVYVLISPQCLSMANHLQTVWWY